MEIKKYLLNGFLLIVPVLLWNLFLADSLPPAYQPDVFWKDIPDVIAYGENILRIIVLVLLPLIMPLSIKNRTAKTGLFLYITGIAIYFLSWIMLICFPESAWSISAIGFMAPAYTTIIWFAGIGLTGNQSFFRIPYLSVIYIGLSIAFVVFHTLHTYIVFQRL